MKKIVTILLLVAFAHQSFYQSMVVFDFYANQDYIARTSCINRARPQMHCNGKCQLMKKMQRQEQQEKEDAGKNGDNKNGIVSSKSFYPQLPHCAQRLVSISFPYYADGSITQPSPAIFHPPQV